MRTTPVQLLAPALAAVLALGLGGCDSLNANIDDAQAKADAAREAVQDGVETLRWCSGAVKLAAAVSQRDVEAARAAAEDLADKAPEELQPEVATILAAVEQADADGSTEPLRTEEVRAAGEEVLSYSRSRCNVSGNG